MAAARGDTPSPLVRTLAVAVLLAGGLLLFELACQGYARVVVFPRMDALRANPRHYYVASDNPVLAYELEPGRTVEHGEDRLSINRWGIRDASDDLAVDRRRLGVLGDSVVFGVAHSDERTISSLLQTQLDPEGRELRVFNLGMPGLNLVELVEYLRIKDRVYDLDEAVYLMNLNDLARRNSVYEGADNGLYRTYRRPWLMSLLFGRKAVYRWVKGSSPSGGPRWYRWMYDGNAEYAHVQLGRMADYARKNDIRFGVVLLPAGSAYGPDGYVLADIHARLASLLESEGIPHLDPTQAFADDPTRYFDETDHPSDAGNLKLAEVMSEFLKGLDGVTRSARRAEGG